MARVLVSLSMVSAQRLGNALTKLLPAHEWEVVPREELSPMAYSVEGVEGLDAERAGKTVYLWILFGHSDKVGTTAHRARVL